MSTGCENDGRSVSREILACSDDPQHEAAAVSLFEDRAMIETQRLRREQRLSAAGRLDAERRQGRRPDRSFVSCTAPDADLPRRGGGMAEECHSPEAGRLGRGSVRHRRHPRLIAFEHAAFTVERGTHRTEFACRDRV